MTKTIGRLLATAGALVLLAPAAASAAPATTSCKPLQVGTTAARVFVRCASATGGIVYFAFATADAPAAARVLSLMSTAEVAGHTLGITYDPSDTAGATIGCEAANCRLILGVWLTN